MPGLFDKLLNGASRGQANQNGSGSTNQELAAPSTEITLSLSHDIIRLIAVADNLTIKDILNLMVTNKNIREALNHASFWRAIISKHYGVSINNKVDAALLKKTYRALYKRNIVNNSGNVKGFVSNLLAGNFKTAKSIWKKNNPKILYKEENDPEMWKIICNAYFPRVDYKEVSEDGYGAEYLRLLEQRQEFVKKAAATLFKAIEDRDWGKAEEYIDEAIRLNAVNVRTSQEIFSGGTTLAFAARDGKCEIVIKLLAAGADPNIVDDEGISPLMVPSENGHEEIVELLLAAEADPNIVDDEGWSPIMFASQNGHEEIVELLIKAGAAVNAASTKGNLKGRTALIQASHQGHTGIVIKLLATEADPNIVSDGGVSPLMVAYENGHEEIVELLIKAGAAVNAVITKGNLKGRTALTQASGKGHIGIVIKLLAAGADPNMVDDKGWSPLMVASQNGHEEIVELLIKAGAAVNAASTKGNLKGRTALIQASHQGHTGIVIKLLKAGADPNMVSYGGWSSLILASDYGREEIVELLIKVGADPNIVNIVNRVYLLSALMKIKSPEGRALKLINILIDKKRFSKAAELISKPYSVLQLEHLASLASDLHGEVNNAEYMQSLNESEKSDMQKLIDAVEEKSAAIAKDSSADVTHDISLEETNNENMKEILSNINNYLNYEESSNATIDEIAVAAEKLSEKELQSVANKIRHEEPTSNGKEEKTKDYESRVTELIIALSKIIFEKQLLQQQAVALHSTAANGGNGKSGSMASSSLPASLKAKDKERSLQIG